MHFIPDIYLFTDLVTGGKSGNSSGFGMVLTAEMNTGTFLSAELCSNPAGGGARSA